MSTQGSSSTTCCVTATMLPGSTFGPRLLSNSSSSSGNFLLVFLNKHSMVLVVILLLLLWYRLGMQNQVVVNLVILLLLVSDMLLLLLLLLLQQHLLLVLQWLSQMALLLLLNRFLLVQTHLRNLLLSCAVVNYISRFVVAFQLRSTLRIATQCQIGFLSHNLVVVGSLIQKLFRIVLLLLMIRSVMFSRTDASTTRISMRSSFLCNLMTQYFRWLRLLILLLLFVVNQTRWMFRLRNYLLSKRSLLLLVVVVWLRLLAACLRVRRVLNVVGVHWLSVLLVQLQVVHRFLVWST